MSSEENLSNSQSDEGSEKKEKKESKEKDNKQKKEDNALPNEKSSSLFKGTSFFGNKEISPSSRVNYYTSRMKIQNIDKKENEIKNENSKNLGQNLKKNDNENISHNTSLFIEEMSKNNCLPKLQNIVSTANFKCILDLREIALKAKNAEYNPRRFAAVIMRIKEPKTTALIFSSGKMVCTGARTEEESRQASRTYAKIILKLGFPVKFSEFTVQKKFCSYEPEMFPGLIFHMLEPKIVLLIFVSGKIVLTGAKKREDIYRAYQKIIPILNQFKKSEYKGKEFENLLNIVNTKFDFGKEYNNKTIDNGKGN